MMKKYLAILIMLLPTAVTIYFFWLIFLSPNYEAEVVEFCNELVIGTRKSELLYRAKNVNGAKLSDHKGGKSHILKSDGFSYAYCNMEFKEEKLYKKTLGIS